MRTRLFSVLCSLLFVTATLGCSKKDDKGASKSVTSSKGSQSGSSKGDNGASKDRKPAPVPIKAYEELKTLFDKTFEGVDTSKSADVNAAIAKWKALAGEPDRIDGGESYWYRKDKNGTCMKVMTLQGGGYSSGGADVKYCK